MHDTLHVCRHNEDTMNYEDEIHPDNPIYEDTTQSEQTNYSTHGPAYEQVLVNQETGYNIINREEALGPHSTPWISSPNNESEVQYSTLNLTEQEPDSPRQETTEYSALERGEETKEERKDSRLPQEYEVPQN